MRERERERERERGGGGGGCMIEREEGKRFSRGYKEEKYCSRNEEEKDERNHAQNYCAVDLQ